MLPSGIMVLAVMDSWWPGHKSKGGVEGCDICSRKNKAPVNLIVSKAKCGHKAICIHVPIKLRPELHLLNFVLAT